MWTPENRKRYDRSQLRYPSDLTDEELALVKPVIPPAKRGGRKREADERDVLNAICTCSRPVASGGRCRRIFRPKARCGPIWIYGATTAPRSGSITSFM